MGHAIRMSKASGFFFAAAIFISQAKYAPSVLAKAIFDSLYLLFCFIAHALWYLSSKLLPEHPGLKNRWYGFAEFKNQHIAAAVIGTIAVIFSVLAFFYPVAFIACWLFALSNTIWLISEYHKMKILGKGDNRPLTFELEYSNKRQRAYLQYAGVITTMAIITSIATTLALIFPPYALAIMTLSAIIGVCMSAIAAQKWIQYFLFPYPPEQTKGSYNNLLINPSFQNNHLVELNGDLELDNKVEVSSSTDIIMLVQDNLKETYHEQGRTEDIETNPRTNQITF